MLVGIVIDRNRIGRGSFAFLGADDAALDPVVDHTPADAISRANLADGQGAGWSCRSGDAVFGPGFDTIRGSPLPASRRMTSL